MRTTLVELHAESVKGWKIGGVELDHACAPAAQCCRRELHVVVIWLCQDEDCSGHGTLYRSQPVRTADTDLVLTAAWETDRAPAPGQPHLLVEVHVRIGEDEEAGRLADVDRAAPRH